MLTNKMTLLIHSCGAYSDLWDGQVELLNRNWADRNVKTIILTDTNPNGYEYEGIDVVCAGQSKEITERLTHVLPFIETEYVFVTLDDYYLIEKVDNARIEYLLSQMDEQKLDYIRLFPDPPSKDKIGDGLYKIHQEERKSSYYVNLYAGIWRKSFIEKTLGETLNAWQYEVSLTPIVHKLNTPCAMTFGKEYVILDVVRKGKLLHKAYNYFKKDPVYKGTRSVIARREELKLAFRTFLNQHLPRKVTQTLKKIMIKCGKTFYSPLDE